LALPNPCAQDTVALAAQIRRHQFPFLGTTIETGPEIRWRRDYTRGIETSLNYFRRIPFLDTSRTGDHKLIWELNRHQHLVVLAQAYVLTGDVRNLDEIRTQLESWFIQNPFQRGINWASALEVAFRALSWMRVYGLVGSQLAYEFRVRWLGMLYLHARHLENNLSFYFSPNTHLLGEALVLHALGLFFHAEGWQALGARVVREQMDRQVRADGSHFEQSTYYHLYALEMFRLHATLTEPTPAYRAKLERMTEYLQAVTGPSGTLPLLGDDDGGRLGFRFTVTDITPRTWESRLFPDAGIAVMTADNVHAIVKAGGFGPGPAGHSHADALSIVLRCGDEEILIDPGTYTYTGDAQWRDWFRGTGAHNTIRIDGIDQATAAGPFRWVDKPTVSVLSWETSVERDILEAECRFAGFTHRRRVEFRKPDVFLITDDIHGPPGEHEIEQLWHLGSLEARGKLVLAEPCELVQSWRSSAFGEKHPAPLLRVHRRCSLPVRLEARIEVNP
jgi:hypothetical protein